MYQITFSFPWSHKRLNITFFTYAVVVPKTCKHTLMCKMWCSYPLIANHKLLYFDIFFIPTVSCCLRTSQPSLTFGCLWRPWRKRASLVWSATCGTASSKYILYPVYSNTHSNCHDTISNLHLYLAWNIYFIVLCVFLDDCTETVSSLVWWWSYLIDGCQDRGNGGTSP